MKQSDVRDVIDLWASLSASLGEEFAWIQVFENRGTAMGASNPHPHGQIWAAGRIPSRGLREDAAQRRYFESKRRAMLLDYLAQESDGPRQIQAGREWVTVVPFWAAWPYETLIVPRRACGRLSDLDDRQRAALAEDLTELLNRYDDLFDIPFPYSMGWHQAPFDGVERPHWQLHAHIFPPLLQADQRKFMVGYELLSELQRDITPEDAAQRLRAASGAVAAVR
jgi:UDPglucose--hexose-1-phosphate uridylyltransferase